MKSVSAKLLLLSLLAGFAIAADATKPRELVIEGDYQGDVRNGPWNYTGTAAAPIKAKVSKLNISSTTAKLIAPAGTPIATANGQRDAEFGGKVMVTRGQVTAEGTSLKYSEKTGAGVLSSTGQTKMVYTPENKDGDPVNVTANSISFDVDTDQSTSKGSVKLLNGRQSAISETLQFDEKTELAVLGGGVTLIRQPNKAGENVLTITGTDAKIQTNKDKKLLLITGKSVKLVDGNLTTTGTTIYYNDKNNTAIVEGNSTALAKSIDSKSKTEIKGLTLEHRTDLHRAKLVSGVKIPVEQFK
jgi:lipopolysaccharide export system protein LptA